MVEMHINTAFGSVTITYNTADELKQILEHLEDQVTAIQEVATKISPPIPRPIKLGFERWYTFKSDGKVELLELPKQLTKRVALLLWAYYPQRVTVEAVEQETGIDGVVEKVLGQTNNRKYFKRDGEWVTLSQEGIELVQAKFGPSGESGVPDEDGETKE